jgi:hypothetical protein
MNDYGALADRLDAIVAELDEIMFDNLREAVAKGEPRPTDDKRLMQARRSIEKAAHVLRGRPSVDE